MTVTQVGIVPPWLDPNTPIIMGDDNYLPVLPVVPEPPDWDAVHYDHGDPGTEPGACVVEGDLALGA